MPGLCPSENWGPANSLDSINLRCVQPVPFFDRIIPDSCACFRKVLTCFSDVPERSASERIEVIISPASTLTSSPPSTICDGRKLTPQTIVMYTAMYSGLRAIHVSRIDLSTFTHPSVMAANRHPHPLIFCYGAT